MAALISIVLIEVVIVVAVVVTQDHKNNAALVATPSSTPVPSSPATTSARGALDVTGLATMDPFTATDAVWLVFQDATGDVKLSRLTTGSSRAPESLGLEDVMNGSYIDSISYRISNIVYVS